VVPDDLLLYVMDRPSQIKGVPLNENQGRDVMIPIIGGSISAVDYDRKTDYIIYADSHRYIMIR